MSLRFGSGLKNLKQYSTGAAVGVVDYGSPAFSSLQSLSSAKSEGGLKITPEEFRSSVNAVFGGRTGSEVFRHLPRSVPRNKIPLLQECFADALERFVCHCDVPTDEPLRSLSGAYVASPEMHKSLLERCAILQEPVVVEADRWNNVVKDQKCLLCIDLLAAPVILGCTHSFCGSCIHNYTHCGGDSEADVTHFCPICRSEILSKGIYERNLDMSIVNQVESLHFSCEQIEDWKARREEYLELMKEAAVGRSSDDDSKEDDLVFEDMDLFLKWAIPFIAVCIVCVVVAGRRLRAHSASI
jgi:hypothetical protein